MDTGVAALIEPIDSWDSSALTWRQSTRSEFILAGHWREQTGKLIRTKINKRSNFNCLECWHNIRWNKAIAEGKNTESIRQWVSSLFETRQAHSLWYYYLIKAAERAQ